ncbi:MAG: hypothetical protein EBR02_01880 [Alphaproteobacteria bacterium]|nr:hypothetical protein [Alphaproteobacteria bacterium]
MLATFIILFREILEISLILSIVLAATRGIAGRARWIWTGIAGGVAGSAVVAFFAGAISEAMEGMGQELFNASILFVAVLMIGWTVVWMQQHGKELAQKIKHVGHSVHSGELPLYALATIVSLSMWREGAEIVLFMYGILSTTQDSLLAIIAGGAAGAVSAATLGLLIYLGLIKISTKYVFTVTSSLLILLACGMSAQAAGYLIAAGFLPDIIPQLWDSSALLSESSLLGKILHAMLGYSERPTGMQAIFYLLTFATIYGLTHMKKRLSTPALKPTAAALALCAFSTPDAAHALDVKSPYVEQGIMEVESKNRFDFDDRASEDRFRQHIVGVGYGFNRWWFAELEGEWEKEAQHGYSFNATEIENKFQLTEQGEYFVDVGALLAYEFSHEQGGADKVEAGLLLGKLTTDWSHLANIIVEQEVGANKNANPELDLKWQTTYNYSKLANPGFEYYGELGEASDMQGWDTQKHRIGPVVLGNLGSGVKYDIGWLFGTSKATEDNVIKLNLEYEFSL